MGKLHLEYLKLNSQSQGDHWQIVTEENRDALQTHEVELGDSASVMSQRIIQILTQNTEHSQWPLEDRMNATRELAKMSLDPTFVFQFFSQRGLIHIMHLFTSGRLPHDQARMMAAMRNMLDVLGVSQHERKENSITVRRMHEMDEEAVRALPVIMAAVRKGDHLTKLAAIRLINALLKRCERKPRSDMIKFLSTPASEEAFQSFKDGIQLVDQDSDFRQDMIEQHAEVKQTINVGLEVFLSKGQFHHEITTKVTLTGSSRLDFPGVLEELDAILKQEFSAERKTMCDLIKESFEVESLHAAFEVFDGHRIEQEVCLFILKQIFPEKNELLKTLSSSPMDNFESMADILVFVEAIIKSGLAAQKRNGLIFTLGNTGVGKTSLVNTVKRFVDNPTADPCPVLAEEHKELLETQVLEVYQDISFHSATEFEVQVKDVFSRPVLINLKEAMESAKVAERDEKYGMKIVDMGGHKEYYICSTLFIASSGVFLVCTDSSSLADVKGVEDEYYSRVGTYLDLITQATAMSGIKPKIVLVATKADGSEVMEESYEKLLNVVKAHIASRETDCFLVNEVLRTSSKNVTKQSVEEFYGQISALCSDVFLTAERCAPLSWYQLLEEMQRYPWVTLDQVREMVKEIERKNAGAENVSEEELKNLEILKTLLTTLTIEEVAQHEQDSRKRAELEKDAKSSSKDHQVQTVSKTSTEIPRHRLDSIVKESAPRRTMVRTHTQDSFAQSQEEKILGDVEPILDFWVGRGEILWFKGKERGRLRDKVITNPMDFVKSLRTMISHKAIKSFDNKVKFLGAKNALLSKGLLSFESFKVLYASVPGQKFSEEEVWDYLEELGLICPLVKDGERFALVPCLITDSMEKKIKSSEKMMEESPEAVGIEYMFDRNSSSIGMYHLFLSSFAQTFLWAENGGEILFASSQKVEGRTLGTIGGVKGVLKWHTEGVREPQDFEFLILECEDTLRSSDVEENHPSNSFAVHRGVRFHIKPSEGPITKASIEILKKMNSVFTVDPKSVQKSLVCKECHLDGGFHGYFELEENLGLVSEVDLCSRLHHNMDKRIIRFFKESDKRKPFKLQSLMEMEKKKLGLQEFKTSQIQARILSGRLDIGEQIWVYHDKETDPANAIARVNPYAHVMVYVGPREEQGIVVHEVVHVGKDSMRGFSKATIKRENVQTAIKPHNQVFLGHKIDSVQFSGNIRQKIAARAIACANPPKIVFNYDHR